MSQERYTPGYSTAAVSFMQRRTAEQHAAFLIPYLEDGQHLLDIGCGPGTITAGLAKAVGSGHVVAIDQELTQLATAEQFIRERNLKNVRFQQGSVYTLPFSDSTFDVVFAHAVFEHLANPIHALTEIRRVLKIGGLVGLRSPDWGGFLVHPMSAALKGALEYYQSVQRFNGGDVHAGRKLKEWVCAAGFKNARWHPEFDFTEDLPTICSYLANQIKLTTHSTAFLNCKMTYEQLEAYSAALEKLPLQDGAVFAGSWVQSSQRSRIHLPINLQHSGAPPERFYRTFQSIAPKRTRR